MGGAHNKEAGPGEKVEGHGGKQISHFKEATVGKGRSAREQKANHVSDSEEEGNTGDKTGRVFKEFIQAAEVSLKNKTTG